VLLPWLMRASSGGFRTRRPGGHFVRSAFGVCAVYCFFYGIAHLPLASAMLLTYSTPLFVPFIAWWWIKERPPMIVFPAVILGLIGVGFIVKPGGGISLWAGLVGALSGLFAACAMVSIRRISDTEPATRIVFYFSALASLISAVPLLWAWRTPTPGQWVLLILSGVCATWGQLALTRAYALAPAARVGPFIYFAVIFSALLSWLIWGETLDRGFVIGALLVIATCVMVGWRRAEPQLEE
jgi:drug/metabolite transporter (DMT)-like permease